MPLSQRARSTAMSSLRLECIRVHVTRIADGVFRTARLDRLSGMPTTTDPSLTLRRRGLTFRSATLDDAVFAADVSTAVRPDEPEDPASWRHWWASDDPAWTNERWIVLRGDKPIGYARHNHAPWEQQSKRYGRIG